MNSNTRPTQFNYRAKKGRPRKADHGHSIVLTESWTRDSYGFGQRRAITCQCGKRYTGNGDRAYYSYDAHRRQAIETEK